MRLESYPIEKLKKEILEIAKKYVDLQDTRLFFFGSRVANKGTERSDIDIGIEAPVKIPLSKMAQIQEEVESLPTLYKIEIVDFRRVAPIFREVALQQTEPIWPLKTS